MYNWAVDQRKLMFAKTEGNHMFSGRRLERYRQMSMRRAERRNAIRFLARLFGRRRKPE